jgi:peroxiredoxin
MTARSLTALMLVMLVAAAHAQETLFRDFDGQPQTLESFTGNGKWLVVMIWAHDCHVCNVEAESYAQFHEDHKDGKASVLGISLDGADKQAEAAAFIERHDLPFPNLIGEPMQTMLYYGQQTGARFRGTPSILLFGPDGELRAAQAGAVPTASIEAYIAQNS